MRIIQRPLFHDLDYFVAYRFIKDKRKFDPKDIKNGYFQVVKSRCDEWFADPFPFEFNGKIYIFAERMNKWKGKGTIAFCEILRDGSHTGFNEVLDEPFHLSYPNIFECYNNIYLIPESGHNRDIRIYKAKSFPYVWELDNIILKGENFVDTSILSLENDLLQLVTFDWDNKKQIFFNYNVTSRKICLYPDNIKMLNERPGGNSINDIRVLQDCSRVYGERILFRKMNSMNFVEGLGCDSYNGELTAKDISCNNIMQYSRIHTFNRSQSLEVVDLLANRINPLKQIIRLYHHI